MVWALQLPLPTVARVNDRVCIVSLLPTPYLASAILLDNIHTILRLLDAMADPARPPSDQTAGVLQILLQQLPDAWDIRTLCSLLQVSTSSRLAVLTAGVPCKVDARSHLFAAGADQVSLAKFAGFCGWFPNHAGLVSALDMLGVGREAGLDQLLCLALQSAQQASALAAPAAAEAVTPTGLARPAQQLQLAQFQAGFMPAPATLEALSDVTTLTHLKIAPLSLSDLSPQACCCLGRLTGLSCLQLHPNSAPLIFPAELSSALSGMQGLQQLTLIGRMDPPSLRQLPAQLGELEVAAPADLDTHDGTAVCVDLGHLTQLTKLSILVDEIDSVVLPESIIQLNFSAELSFAGPPPVRPPLALPHLTQLTYHDNIMDEFGPQLASLPDLLSLSLRFNSVDDGVSPELSRALSQAVSAVTQLTSLCMDRFSMTSMDKPRPDDAIVELRDTLRQLPALCSLTLTSFKLQPMDVFRWPMLSSLTALKLQYCDTLGDVAAAALACKLTGLRDLDLSNCGLHSPVLWPAFASCTGLHYLSLADNALGIDDGTLLLLTTLTQLTELEAGGLPYNVSAESEAEFERAMPQLRWYVDQ